VSSAFWKQFEDVSPIDCLDMKRAIQEKIYEETKMMTWKERVEYFRRGSAEFRSGPAGTSLRTEATALREDASEYGSGPGQQQQESHDKGLDQ